MCYTSFRILTFEKIFFKKKLLIHATPEMPIKNHIPNVTGILATKKNGKTFMPSISSVYGILDIPSNNAFFTVAFRLFSK